MHILFLSPRFPPTSAADSQRVRMLLPHLAVHGCTAEVLALDPVCCIDPLDPWQAIHLPSDIPVHRVNGFSRRWSRIPGLGSIESRCYQAMASAGSHLIRHRHFDLVYISTTAFGFFRLGLLWFHRHGVPFVLDYQDPWVNDFYRTNHSIKPPGGYFKYTIVDRLNRFFEPRVLQFTAGITSVSAAYIAQLEDRYQYLSPIPSLVLPFPGSEQDFQHLENISLSELPFDPHDGLIHWVCIGRADANLFHLSLSSLFDAIARFAPTDVRQRLRLHFLGTSYALAGRTILSIPHLAAQYGLENIVDERPERLPLSLTLAALKAADALLVLGSSDPTYTASKLVPYLLARRPLLAIMHEDSLVCDILKNCGGGTLVSFSDSTTVLELSSRIADSWLSSHHHSHLLPLDMLTLTPYTAADQARQLLSFFRRCA